MSRDEQQQDTYGFDAEPKRRAVGNGIIDEQNLDNLLPKMILLYRL